MMEEHEELLFAPEDLAQTVEHEDETGPGHEHEHEPLPGGQAAVSNAQTEDAPWLELAEKYPGFGAVCGQKDFIEAVRGGERPAEAYLRLENARLAKRLDETKKAALIRDMAMGEVASSAGEEPGDPFLAGLSYMR